MIGVHSHPVVRSLRALLRLEMAAGASSYCRALLANLQYFMALAKSSDLSLKGPPENEKFGVNL